MRDGLYEMVRDAAAGCPAAELRVEAAGALLEEAARLVLLPTPPEHDPAPDELDGGDDDQPDVELAGHPQAHERDGDARAA